MQKIPNIITKRSINGTSEIAISSNQVQVFIDHETMDNVLNGTYMHELRLFDPDSAESVAAIGKVKVYNSLTVDL